ncbi:MAG TPA: ABC transporter substrate-binding protein [Chloroflexota bacterium]|nr:ABC transporter substrate-binding protein [Chloroflexota bacterium]
MASGGPRRRAKGAGVILTLALLLSSAACAPSQAPAPSARPGAADPTSSAPAGAAQAAAPASTAAPPAPTHLRIASTAVAASMSPLWVAKDTGIYERNGLDVEIVNLAAGTLAVQGLLAGELDFAYNVASSLITANLGGADLVMLAGGVNTMIFSVAVAPGIERVEDLRGKRLGITRLGTSTDFNARYLLQRYGLQPEIDVAFVQLNGNPEILTGLHAGAIDAGMLSHPTVVQARQQGFRAIVDLGTLGIPYQHTGVMTTRRYAEANPDVVRAVVRSHVEAIHRFKTDKAAALDSLARRTQVGDPTLLEETHEAYANVYLERLPYVTVPGMQLDLDALSATTPVPPGTRVENWVDNRFMEEIERSGLIERLYGR